MKPYRYFKTAAKIGLSGRLFKCIIAFLFVTLLPQLVFLSASHFKFSQYQFLTVSLLSLLILIPCFRMGAIGFLFDSIEKKETSLGNMFDGFKYILKLIPLNLSKIISYLPLVLIVFLAYYFISPETMDILTKYAEDPAKNLALLDKVSDKDFYIMLFSETGIVLSLIFAIIINSYLILTEYILYNEQLSGIKAVIRSIKLMKGHILYYIGFNLSYIFWYLASTFTMGYSDLFLNPYKEASFIMFYNYLRHLNGECEVYEPKIEESELYEEE